MRDGTGRNRRPVRARADRAVTTSVRPINSDALGTKGESRFAELCADAGLHSNKVGNDRTGWDYYVEFPFPAPSSADRLDARPQPPECKVQVKTVWRETSDVRLRLSSAERLAKWVGPAFVIVLVVDADTLGFVSMHALHVRDGVLSAVLEALRKCEQDGSTKVNHRTVALNHLRDGETLPVSGAALRDYVARTVSAGPAAYAAGKQAERENLGVRGARWSGRMVLEATDEAEVSDIMLGLRRGKVRSFSIEETRWDITLPDRFSGAASEVEIRLHARPGHLTLRHGSLVVSEKVDIFLPADIHLRPEAMKARICGEGFEILLDRMTGKLGYEFAPDNEAGMTVNAWRRLVRAQQILLSGGRLQLREGGNTILNMDMKPDGAHVTVEHLRQTDALLNRLRVVADAADGGEFRVTSADFNAAWAQIDFLHDLLTASAELSLNSFRLVPTEKFPLDLGTVDCLFVGRFRLRDQQMAWCAVAPVDVVYEAADAVRFVVSDMSLRRVELFDGGPGHFTDFKTLVQEETSISVTVDVGNMFRT